MAAAKRMKEEEQQLKIQNWINSHELPRLEVEGFTPKYKKIVKEIAEGFQALISESAKKANLPF